MSHCKHLLLGLFFLLSCSLFQGCSWLLPRQPIPVKVVDAETGKPIAKARVALRKLGIYCLPPFNNATDQVGRTTVSRANLKDHFDSFEILAKADGYISSRYFDEAENQWIDADRSIPQATVHLYRLPHPELAIIIPQGYRGPICCELIPQKAFLQGKPGQRQFTFRTNESGYVGIHASPLLTRDSSDYSFTFVEQGTGKKIPDEPKSGKVSARFVESVRREHSYLWVIGSDEDEARIRRVVEHQTPEGVFMYENREAIEALFQAAKTGKKAP